MVSAANSLTANFEIYSHRYLIDLLELTNRDSSEFHVTKIK